MRHLEDFVNQPTRGWIICARCRVYRNCYGHQMEWSQLPSVQRDRLCLLPALQQPDIHPRGPPPPPLDLRQKYSYLDTNFVDGLETDVLFHCHKKSYEPAGASARLSWYICMGEHADGFLSTIGCASWKLRFKAGHSSESRENFCALQP